MHGLKQTKKLLQNMQSARLLKKRRLCYLGASTPFLHFKRHLAPNLHIWAPIPRNKKIKKPPNKIGGRKTLKILLYSTVRLSVKPQETSYLGQNAVKTVD